MDAAPARPWLRRAAAALGAGWPNRCAVCHVDTAGRTARLCSDCRRCFAAAVPRCRHCALPLPGGATVCGSCLAAPPPWVRAVAACDYGHPWDRLLADFKFHAAIDLAPALAALLAAALPGDAARVDALLPVPLAPARLAERGYNQALLLAAPLARRLARRCAAGWLQRPIETAHQIALPREARAANVRGVFAVAPKALTAVRGARLALVDDVMTTGATLAEAARTLQAAGAAEVEVWVVARTPRE